MAANNKEKNKDSTLFENLYPMGYLPYRVKWFDYIIAGFLTLVSFILYMRTLTPTVGAGDAGELITATYNMGACHAPGFPLFGILAKLFTFIPVNDIAYRVNMFAGVCAAGTIFFLYLFAVKLLGLNRDKSSSQGKKHGLDLKIHIPAIGASLVLAFSEVFWSQGIIGEVYSLNIFLVSAMLYIMLLWFEEIVYFRKSNEFHLAERRSLLLAFIMGLSLTNHQLPMWFIAGWAVMLLIPMAFVVISERPDKDKKELRQRIFPLILLAGFVILAIYLIYTHAYKVPLIMPKDKAPILVAIFIVPAYLTIYTVISKLSGAKPNWVDNLMRILMFGSWLLIFAMTVYLYMMIRARAIAPLPEPKPLSWGDTQTFDILLNHMLRKQYGRAGGNLVNFGGQMLAVLDIHIEQFHWINAIFAFFGLIYLFIKDKIWAIFTLFSKLLLLIALVRFVNFEIHPRNLAFQEVMYIQSFFIWAVYIGFGYQMVLDLTGGFKKFWQKRILQKAEEIE
jgi:hypothetical protein